MKYPLTIAIDDDDTFTADTTAWTKVIELLQSFGHRVICVSARLNSDNQRRELECALPEKVEVYLSYSAQKKDYMASLGQRIDIWIDDCPEAIPSRSDMLLMVK